MSSTEDRPATTFRRLTRRHLLGLGIGVAAVAGAGVGAAQLLGPRPIGPKDVRVTAAENERRRSGRVVQRTLRAGPTTLDLGGRAVQTWAYAEAGPTGPLRVTAGDELRVHLVNDLPAPTTVHWHGLALRNDMDGVPGLTMDPVAPGAAFDYSFIVPHPGTYWLHSHVGTQLDTGMAAALIVDDPNETGLYDEEAVLVLDDWTDGWGGGPDAILAAARRNGMGGMRGMRGMDMEGDHMRMGMPTSDKPLGSDTGDVSYPAHLINGRLPSAPHVIRARPRQRIRLRLVNAAADTAYRFAVTGHPLTITHTDGYPVLPTEKDTVIIGMGERYDLMVTAQEGVFPVVAQPEGKTDPAAMAVLRTGAGTVTADAAGEKLRGRLVRYDDLVATDAVALRAREPDRELRMTLTMSDSGRRWLINGRAYPDHQPLQVSSDERIRLVLENQSMMFHPMHLHGHTFALTHPDGRGLRKDTVNVAPMQQLSVDFDSDNPGQWLAHCHNAYHAELGMMSSLSYQT